MVADGSRAGAAVGRRWCWGTWSVLIAAGIWLLFVVVHRGFSGRVWWWTLPDLAPPVVFLAVPAALLLATPLARPARGRIAALVLASLALGWPVAGVNLTALWHRPGPVPPDAVTVFAWNTWYWDQLARGPDAPSPMVRPPRDTDRFYRYLREQDADVYLLQEYLYFSADWQPIRVDHLDRLRREFPGFHVAVSGELLTLSRFPLVLTRPLDLRPWLSRQWEDLPPPDSQLPAYHTVKTLRTDLRIAGRVVSFYNSHLHVPVLALPTLDQADRDDLRERHDLRQADYRALAADVAGNPHPIVLAGDLNTTPAMGLLGALPDRLVDAVPATGALYPTSWARVGLPMWRLDWVFTTTDVDIHRYVLVRPAGLSDHHGQRVTVSISGCPGGTPCG
nr:endonuclease/exonuclease/phosphatase family protein [Micromonospora sp. DSM 115978]